MARGFGLFVLATVAAVSSAQMDSSIGGKSVDTYHVPIFDAKNRLYLYSGGD